MPVHDWTRVDAGLFHAFHQSWAVHIQDALNGGILPAGTLPGQQRIRGPIPDVLTLRLPRDKQKPTNEGGVADRPGPDDWVVRRTDKEIYGRRANRVTVRHRHGDVVAVIEIVSPGNKDTVAECRSFVRKATDLVAQEVNLLIVDLFPPGKHDPARLSELIWDEIGGVDPEGLWPAFCRPTSR